MEETRRRRTRRGDRRAVPRGAPARAGDTPRPRRGERAAGVLLLAAGAIVVVAHLVVGPLGLIARSRRRRAGARGGAAPEDLGTPS